MPNNEPTPNKSTVSQVMNLNTSAKKMLGFSDDTYTAVGNIQDRGQKFQEIINRTLDVAHGVSNGSIIDFAQSIRSTQNTKLKKSIYSSNTQMDLTQQLQSNAGTLFSYFQGVNNNKYIEIADLQFISKFIPALGAAVDTILDSVAATDDMASSSVDRNFVFEDTISKKDQDLILKEIKKIEREHNLRKKIKNTVMYSTLVSGNYYAYNIPYADLFEQYSRDQASATNEVPFGNGAKTKSQAKANAVGLTEATESVTVDSDLIKSIVMEETMISNKGNKNASSDVNKYASELENTLNSRISTVKFIKSPILEEALEDVPGMMAAMETANDPAYKAVYDKYFGTTNIKVDDGKVADTGTIDIARAEKNFDIDGCYLKFIAPRYMIPIKLMNEVVGYYHITAEKTQTTKFNSANNQTMNLMGQDGSVFNTVTLSEQHRDQIITNMVQSIIDNVIAQFGKEFVKKNSEFKKVIADCIRYHGYMDNEYHVQFIPAKYIIKFTIDEDDNGEGKSVLANAIFPAKLLLSLQVSKILNYLNKSGDRTIMHVSKGPIDVNTGNQVQRVIRNVQECNITFSDLLSTNLVFNKFGRNQNIIMPTSRSGNHLVEFETQEGQSIDMSSDYEQNLEKQAIMGTGVPSVIMEYIGQTDFAKGFETANIKYSNRIASIQSDFEEPLTHLYNELIQASSLSDEIKKEAYGHFEFRLPRPKVLAVSNSSEYLGTLQNLMQIITSIEYGESNTDDQDEVKRKEEFVRLAVRKYAPYIDWSEMDSFKDQAAENYNQFKDKLRNSSNGDNSSGGIGGSDMSF